jgi:tRNA-2-methylthio-N6-dimethylallyladenosine synthase
MIKKLHIITFGCQMNEADSEMIGASFRRRGFELTDSLKAADAVVVNTCTVRQRAEDKAISQIGRLRKWKLARPDGKLFVVGCAAEKLGEKDIKRRFPFVDEVIGAKSIDAVDGAVEAHFGGSAGPGAEDALKSPVSAFVTAMRGCSLKCSYCVVPSVRGPAVCLPPSAVLAEAAAKAAGGAKEIILLGQTVNAYSYDGPEGRVSFADLLEKVAGLPGVLRVRFMSPHPNYFREDFFRLYRDNPKIARYVHLPVQSGSDKILKAMRRGYTRAQFLDIVARLREAAPDTAVSTDFIVGNPGEGEAEFRDTLSLVPESGVSFAYCFKYSQRAEGEGLAPEIDETEMEARLERLLEEVKKNSRDILNKRIGRIEEVLLESADCGRTSANFVARHEGEEVRAPGALVRMEVTGVHRNTLRGRLIS